MFFSLLNILTTKIVYRTLCYNYFSFLPVYLKIIIFELYEAKDKILLTQARYYKQDLL